MALIDKNTLKDWFSRGKKPLASQFANWIDSYWHKAEKIPMSEVENLTATLNTKAEKLSLTAETNARVQGDTNLQNQIDGLQKTDEKAQPNGYAPLDADNKVPAEHLPAMGGGGGDMLIPTWNSSVTYALNAVVSFNGYIFRSLTDGNNGAPNTAAWEKQFPDVPNNYVFYSRMNGAWHIPTIIPLATADITVDVAESPVNQIVFSSPLLGRVNDSSYCVLVLKSPDWSEFIVLHFRREIDAMYATFTRELPDTTMINGEVLIGYANPDIMVVNFFNPIPLAGTQLFQMDYPDNTNSLVGYWAINNSPINVGGNDIKLVAMDKFGNMTRVDLAYLKQLLNY